MSMRKICLCTTPRRGCILVVILCLLSALFYLLSALHINHVAHCGMKNVDADDNNADVDVVNGTPVYALDRNGVRTREPVYMSDSTENPINNADYIETCRSPWAAHKTLWKALFSSHLIMSYVALIGAVLLTLGVGAQLNGFLVVFLVYAALEILYRSAMTIIYGYFVAATPSNSMTILSLILLAAPIPLWVWSFLTVYEYTHDVSRYRHKVIRQREDEDLQKARMLRFSHSYRGRAPSRAASVQNAHARKMAEDAGYARISISEEVREQRRASVISARAAAAAAAARDGEKMAEYRINKATVTYNSSLNDEQNELLNNSNANGGAHRNP